LAAFTTKTCRPSARPACSTAGNSVAKLGSIRTAMKAALGTISQSSSILFAPEVAARKKHDPGYVAARSIKAVDEADCHRVLATHEDNWNALSGDLGRLCRLCIADNHSHL